MRTRVADILIETLQSSGVKTCYGIVGDTLNRIAHAIDRSEIDWVHMRHEEAGAFAASAEALLTGRLTACAGTRGPGSLHFINGLYEANRHRSPVILIAGGVSLGRLNSALAASCSPVAVPSYPPSMREPIPHLGGRATVETAPSLCARQQRTAARQPLNSRSSYLEKFHGSGASCLQLRRQPAERLPQASAALQSVLE